MGTKCAGVKRLWRPFLAVVVAYAIAIQSLLIVLGGFAPAAKIDSAVTGLELCHQDAQAPVEVPAKNADPGGRPLHLLLCRSAACGDQHRVHRLPPRQCRDGGRGVARRHAGFKAAHPLHDRKSKGSSAQRVIARGY
jgi:hypothetical protein